MAFHQKIGRRAELTRQSLSSTGHPHLGAEEEEHLRQLESRLRDLWHLGRNLILAWCPAPMGILTLVIPSYIVATIGQSVESDPDDDLSFIQDIFSGPKRVTESRLLEISKRLQSEPQYVELTFEPGTQFDLDQIEEVVGRYGLSYVEDRAVALFDIVGFSLYSPLEQVAQLNSLAYSMNAAHSKMLSKKLDINFTRTTTGDGFYVWNRDRNIRANVNLYHFMHLVLADNAIARHKARGNTTPLLRASFHVGAHYEFFQAEGLNPTTYSYIVGDVTIELARLIDKALPGQIVLGDFQAPMPDEKSGELNRVDAIQFIERTQETLSSLEGLILSGEAIDAIKCYLTGARDGNGDFTIKKYLVTDKHGLSRHAFNAKVNIYRENSKPIFLGVQDSELNDFAPTVDERIRFQAAS